MSERKAWFCPSCNKHHAPHVETCPGHHFSIPKSPVDYASRQCSKCGIGLDGVMGYVCSLPHCPCGLGGAYCYAGGNSYTDGGNICVNEGNAS